MLLKELPCQFVPSSAFLESGEQGKAGWYHLFVLGIAPVPPSRGLNQEDREHRRSMFVPLKETTVESLLKTSTHALAKLQVPREQLSEVLEQIYNGSCGAIYRSKMYTGDPAKCKSVVLKTLKGNRGSVRLPLPFLLFYCASLIVNANRLCRHSDVNQQIVVIPTVCRIRREQTVKT